MRRFTQMIALVLGMLAAVDIGVGCKPTQSPNAAGAKGFAPSARMRQTG